MFLLIEWLKLPPHLKTVEVVKNVIKISRPIAQLKKLFQGIDRDGF